jgi:hypothetical protein
MRRELVSVLLAVFMFVLSGSVASAEQLLVNGRTTDIYIVSFKTPADGERPFIWPGIRIEDQPPGTPPVPFGEHSSGQSKADVAVALGLAGELTHILDAINAIIVRVDESEAERLSQLPIVAYVERDSTSILGSAQPSPEGEHAAYRDGVLTIPRVDTSEQVGQYQDASFSLQADGSWKLNGLRSIGNSGVFKIPVDSIELVKADGFPVGAYLRVTAWGWPCGIEGRARILQRQVGSHFDVTISAPVLVSDETYACPAVVQRVRMTVPLQVYGLAAGAYTYDVNGVTGGFSLAADNRYPEDCDSSQVAYCP